MAHADEATEAGYLAEAAHNSWLSLEKYYNFCDDSPAYYAALALNPSLKWQWCAQEWGSDSEKANWLPGIKDKIVDFWHNEYRGQSTVLPTSPPFEDRSVEPGQKRKFRDIDERRMDDLHEYKRIKGATNRYVDAFEQYINQPLESEGTNTLQYWNMRYDSGQQRDLCQMAVDLLAIPCQSSECERVFSAAKLLVTDRRNRLKDDIVEACECLRYWMRPAEAKPEHFDGDNVESELMTKAEFVDDIPGYGEEPEEGLVDDE